MRHYIVQVAGDATSDVHFTAPDDETRAMAKGDRIAFYQQHGDAKPKRGVFVAWGEVDRLGNVDGASVATLKGVQSFKRRVPFAELRSDPRRGRDGAILHVSAEVFNVVLAKSRR